MTETHFGQENLNSAATQYLDFLDVHTQLPGGQIRPITDTEASNLLTAILTGDFPQQNLNILPRTSFSLDISSRKI